MKPEQRSIKALSLWILLWQPNIPIIMERFGDPYKRMGDSDPQREHWIFLFAEMKYLQTQPIVQKYSSHLKEGLADHTEIHFNINNSALKKYRGPSSFQVRVWDISEGHLYLPKINQSSEYSEGACPILGIQNREEGFSPGPSGAPELSANQGNDGPTRHMLWALYTGQAFVGVRIIYSGLQRLWKIGVFP